MAHSITIPFFAFKLHLSEDNFLKVPLMDSESLRINEPIHLLAGKYANKFQEKVLNKGSYQQLMDEYAGEAYEQSSIKVTFEKSKDKISYPAFELEFDYFYTNRGDGFWGTIPMLSLTSYGDVKSSLELNLKEAVRLDFLRNKRLKWVREIISTIWAESIELNKEDILIQFPTLKELEHIEEHTKDEWLPKVAKRVSISRRVVYGREKELEQITKALKGKFTRNVLVVGASGVGKTALIWELIRQKEKRRIPSVFWETTASILIKELTKETGWQDNLAKVCREIARTGAILYVSNFMELFEVGRYEGNNVSIAEYMRPYISRGEVTLVSECSEEELAQIELNNPNYLTSFQTIRLEEPKKELEKIIIHKVNDLAADRNIKISKEAIQETLRLNRRFTPYSGLPGKPIRFLESILINQKNLAQSNIDRSAVIRYFCEETGMPLFMVDPTIPMDVDKTRARFNSNVFGQEKAVESIVNVLSSVKTALTHIGKPIASFLFVGPTGVGKTELAKVLANFMFGSRDKMIRFDMSEYADPYAVTRLTGVSYGSDGLLTSAIHQEPFCVLLFDEIEKAHSNFFDLLLQVLSEGRLTDSRGKLVNFCSTIIIMTSNIGAANLQGNRISLKKETDSDTVTTHFMSAVQQFFRPELYNRIDEVIPFNPLSSETIRFVVEREIKLFKQLEGIHYRRLTIDLSEEVLDYLVEKGYHPQYGARQLQRAIQEYLIEPLSKELNVYDDIDQLTIQLSIVEGALHLHIEVDPLSTELMLEEFDKWNLADIVSGLRRRMDDLKEGNTYINLLNTIQEGERAQKKNAKRFWADKERSERYSNYLLLRQRTEELNKRIENLELQLSLSYLNLVTFTKELEQEEKTWRKDFHTLKVDLCYHVYPYYNSCYIGIFGLPPLPQVELYQAILEKKNLKYRYKTIWYRDALYNEAISIKANEAVAEMIKGKYKKKQYVEITYAMPKKYKFKPPEKGDILVGVVLEIKSPCIYLMFDNEGGVHSWKNVDKKGKKTIVQVSTTDIKPPDGIHKTNYYTEVEARRDYEAEKFYDKQSKQSTKVEQGNYITPLIKFLEQNFEKNLTKELFD